MTSPDPTATPDPWRSLHELLAAMDAEIERVYLERGLKGVRPRFAYPLIRLAHIGPLTIRELAESLGRSHSAISQTVAAMRKEGLVTSEPGPDARTRRIDLTERGRALVPFLEAEWRATHETVAELDGELPYAMTAVVEDARRALERRSMGQRILDHLVEPPRPGQAVPYQVGCGYGAKVLHEPS
ncbi:MarR family winged helix-turn-helix transcriptional regulator [Nonomuraea sp. NPDC050783]|uniref:MarR family winged helix-turn-helix transcriptional regulator n=1 Tax=Nonomuraea sp. NPDC050783 TaxID=3154634 RepID=UPI0034679B30